MNRALVSVVIPCFNHGHYLMSALDSVRAQSWPDMQIIVVDDGSTDDTVQVAQQFMNVIVLSQKNAGLSAARNTGLKQCSGEFVVFLDADDRLLPMALQQGVSCLYRHQEAAFAWGRYQLLAEDTVVDVLRAASCDDQRTYERLLQGNFIGMHATVMYRRSALISAGGFDETLTACEDYELYLRIARTCEVVHHEQVVALYRRHECNMSHDSPNMLESALSVLAAQAPMTRLNVELERSRQIGIRHWKQFYGLRAVRRISRRLSGGQFHQAYHDFQRLVRAVGPAHLLLYFPSWIYTHVASKRAESTRTQQP